MPQYTITPWRNTAELLEVKRELFPHASPSPSSDVAAQSTSTDEEERQHAVNLVSAWSMRGRVPHAVQSTALLVEAQLHEASPGASAFSVRATYAAAFCRFITGYCDIGQGDAGVHRPMHDVAAELDIPASWVDLRHEATHGKLPSAGRLSVATRGALVWLWKNYWEALGDTRAPARRRSASGGAVVAAVNRRNSLSLSTGHGKVMGDKESGAAARRGGDGGDGGPEVTTASLRLILEGFVRRRLVEVKSKAVATARTNATAVDGLEIVKMCRGYEQSLRNLVAVMVGEKMMVPGYRKPQDPMAGAFLIWDPLILTLTNYQTLFLPLLLKRIVSVLADPAYLHPPPDAFRDGLYGWILHILEIIPPSRSIGVTDGEKVRAIVVNECVLMPASSWTGPLARTIVDGADEVFKQQWQVYLSDNW